MADPRYAPDVQDVLYGNSQALWDDDDIDYDDWADDDLISYTPHDADERDTWWV